MSAADAALNVLCAGAPKGAVSGCLERFRDNTGQPFEISFGTAPVIRDRLAGDTSGLDLVVATDEQVDATAAGGLIAADSVVVLGSIAAAVLVPSGQPHPDISTLEAFKAALRAADLVVYNKASSGIYIERMLGEIGLADEIAAKVERTDTGNAVMERIAEAAGTTAIGFGQMTEITRLIAVGVPVTIVGELPDPVGKRTTYAAGMLSAAPHPGPAKDMIAFLRTDEARGILTESGLAEA